MYTKNFQLVDRYVFALTILIVVSLATIFIGSNVKAKPLSLPVYFAQANKELAAGTILSPVNISIKQVSDSKSIPPGAMWLTTPDDAYGFRMHQARGKGEAITGYDLLQSNRTDLVIKSIEPLWSQYAKSSIVCDKKHDFELSRKYEESALTELEKLANANQHLTYMDDENQIFVMLHHLEESKASFAGSLDKSKRRLSAISSPLAIFDLDRLNAEQKKLEKERIDEANVKAVKDKRLYSILSRVLPPKCQVVQFIAKDVQRDTDDLRRVSHRHDLAKTKVNDYAEQVAKYKFPKSNSDRANYYNTLAELQVRSGDFKLAVTKYDEALKVDPSYAAAYSGRGYAKAKLGDYLAALSDFNQAVKFVSDNGGIYFNRGICLCFCDKYKNAVDDFSRALTIDPKDTLAYFYRGLAREHIGDKAASTDFDQVMKLFISPVSLGGPRLELSPNEIHNYYTHNYERRLLSEKSKNTDGKHHQLNENAQLKYLQIMSKALKTGTIDDYSQWLELKPNDPFAYYGRGYDRSHLGDYKGAIEDFTLALKYDPNNAHAYQCRGDAREKLGDSKGATDDHNQAAMRDPLYAMSTAVKSLVGTTSK